MNERISISDKKPDVKSRNVVPQIRRKTESSQSMNSPVDRILYLQRTIGNQAVGKLIKSGVLQAKLRIGQPGDVYEQEADRVAEQVMKMPKTAVQLKPGCPFVKGQSCKEKEEILQTKKVGGETTQSSRAVESRINSLRDGGQPLPESVSTFFEPRFGTDFSQVRVQSDTAAEQSARELNAKAYTVGHNIVFGAGQFAPGTQEGRRLIAHELVHTLQQKGSDVSKNHQSLKVQKKVGDIIQRSLLFESTVNICHNLLETRNFYVSNGGIRVVLLLDPLPLDNKYCNNHTFWVELTKQNEWLWIDDDISTCKSETGGPRSFSIGGLSKGTHYLTISRAFDNPYCCLSGDILVFDEPIAGDSSSCKRDKDPSALDIVHGALDVAGFIPVLGAIPDGINAAIYVVEGDWVNAGLSAVAMVPAWGDGVKLGAIAGKTTIKISEKAAIKLGEEGIAKGLKEVKAASKVEKATLETTEEAAKLAKLEKEAAEEAAKAEKKAVEKTEKEGAKEKKKEKKEGKKGMWGCMDVRCNVYQNLKAKPLNPNCPERVIGAVPYVFPSFDAACKAAQKAANLLVPSGCVKRHCDCKTKCTKK